MRRGKKGATSTPNIRKTGGGGRKLKGVIKKREQLQYGLSAGYKKEEVSEP